MNLMSKWVTMVNEGTYNFPEDNPDEFSNDRSDIRGDEYEDRENLLKDIERVNKDYEQQRKAISEAEEEGNSEDDDPEYDDRWKNSEDWKNIESSLAKFDELMSKKDMNEDPEYVSTHNRMTELMKAGLDKKDNKNEYRRLLNKLKKLMGGEGVSEEDKSYFVSYRVYVAKPQDSKEDIDKALGKDAKDFEEFRDNITSGLKGTKVIRDDIGVKKFEDEKSAAKYMYDQIGILKKQYGIDYSKLRRLQDKTVMPGTGEVNGIPQIVKKTDPDAFGFQYDSTKGGEKVYGKGPKVDKNGEDLGSYKKIDELIFIEFIVYKASMPVPYDGGYDSLLDAWASENIEGYDEMKKRKEEEARRKYEQEREEINKAMQVVDEYQRQQYIDGIIANIVKMSRKDKDDDIDAIFAPIFPDMTKYQRVNEIGPEELEGLSRGQLWGLVRRMDAYLAREYAEEHTKSGDEEKLATDDEILAAARSEVNGGRGSIDGYSTRADATQSDIEDGEDAKKDEEEREKEERQNRRANDMERDMDDVEAGQDSAGGGSGGSFSMLRNMKSNSNGSTIKHSIHGVGLTAREFLYMHQMIPRNEWPKNEKEAKEFVKKIRRDMNN